MCKLLRNTQNSKKIPSKTQDMKTTVVKIKLSYKFSYLGRWFVKYIRFLRCGTYASYRSQHDNAQAYWYLHSYSG